MSQSPNNERRVSSVVDGSGSYPRTDTTSQYSEGNTATQVDDCSLSEGNVPFSLNVFPIQPTQTVNLDKDQPSVRYSRTSKLRAILNDFVIGSKLRYGEIDRYKAKLVAKGFSLKEGIDFDETLSHVVKMVIVRQWNAKLTTALVEHDLEQSKHDYSLYIKQSKDMFIAFLVYVDDIIVTGNYQKEIDASKTFLRSKFMIKDLGVLKYILGIEILENANGICMSQRKYCLKLLHEFGLRAAKPVTTHFPENCVLSINETVSDKFLSNIGEYQKLFDKLIYQAHTRSNISYVMHCLNQHMHYPLQSHLKVPSRVLRYLKNAPSTGVHIYKSSDFKLKCVTDSDSAKCLKTKKSVSGFCVFFGKTIVSWKSMKQATVSRSFVEAEYRCMASATCELIAANPVFHEKIKHFEVDVHVVREKVQAGIIKTKKIASADQTADIFTKALGTTEHKKLFSQLSLIDMFGN
ncbi:ribonuclease H-like domain-containing protein [Tanacetum coccineum]